MRIGDKVILDKELILKSDISKNGLPEWYSEDIFTILDIDYNWVTLNKELNGRNNLRSVNDRKKINMLYLKELKSERKHKLIKIFKFKK